MTSALAAGCSSLTSDRRDAPIPLPDQHGVLREAAREGYGDIDVERRLGEVTHPVLVLAGRHDRACTVVAAKAIATGIPGAELCVFENSAHMMVIEERAGYVAAVEEFLERRT
jgi:pimeloyl-ACP methyl ester carboxylesterase